MRNRLYHFVICRNDHHNMADMARFSVSVSGPICFECCQEGQAISSVNGTLAVAARPPTMMLIIPL